MKKTIDRYIKGYRHYFSIVKAELNCRKKMSHWMWFIFPQVKGLGHSPISNYYAFESHDEVREFWACKELRKQLLELVKIVLQMKNYEEVLKCFGTVDAMKLHSSMTVFWLVTKHRAFKKALKKFYGDVLDERTVKLLAEVL